MEKRRKSVVITMVIAIVVLALFAVGLVLYQLFTGPGIKTEELDASKAKPATTDVNGVWHVVYGQAPNHSSVGFTFEESLPAEDKVTSGSTTHVEGQATVENEKLVSGRFVVDMTQVSTDVEKRDINVRTKIFKTDEHPEATYEVAGPVDLSGVDDQANVSELKIPGTLSIKGKSQDVDPTFKVVRDGDKIIISTTIRINRNDFGVESPEFVAAQIAEEGDVNVLLTLEKS
ncbi:YceI family protein [Corynebacterium pelargi]|uniref:YceI-like domain protein n=1 Tax=Corynebacterium pelargi TaxID=1471400 RepID=A0A410W8W8_9CORY|nr:YceI family protein [Corynebacterium pelargi]QAU52405.1 YceI-like domain protein [Corynebacterium pelargi]GGG67916.1 polyisoprenoid-binding protein [Corynebacterium pelargi]